MTPPLRPYFNHAAFTVARSLLDGEQKEQLLAFHQAVFGWEEMPSMSRPGEQLVLRCRTFEEFLFLIGGDRPATLPADDHLGISVATVDEVHAHRERALACAADDARVEVTEVTVEDFDAVRLTSFYTRHLLPVRIEVQHYEVDASVAEFFWSQPDLPG